MTEQKSSVGTVAEQLVASPAREDGPTVPENRLHTLMCAVLPWASRGGLAILDQGLISGSNFLVSILLARWLLPEQYGAYAVAFAVYILLTLLYQSLVLEPMAVFGGSLFRHNLRGYLSTLIKLHTAISLLIIVILGISALVMHTLGHSTVLAAALAGLTISSPCVLAFGLIRRTFYLELAPAHAAIGAFLYSSLVLAGLFFLYHERLLSPFSAFVLIGVGASTTAILQAFRLHARLSGSGSAPMFMENWRRHWRYGRWALASCIAGWIPAYIYYPLLSSFADMAKSGQLKALMNLTLPMEQTKAALALLFLPYAARVQGRDGNTGSRALSTKLSIIAVSGAVVYWGIIIPLRGPVFHVLYSGRYMEVAHLLPLLAIGQIFWNATYGPAIALRAMESPSSVFAAFGVATAASLLIGVPATWAFGVTGSIWGSNLADIFSLIAVLFLLRRKMAGNNKPLTPTSWRNWFVSPGCAEASAEK